MDFISPIIVVAIAVPVMIAGSAGKKTTSSTSSFVMKINLSTALRTMIVLGILLFGGCIIGSAIAGQFNGWIAVVFGGLFLMCILLLLTQSKGFWESEVEGDILKSTHLWFFKKAINIKDIDHCLVTSNGISVYLKGSQSRALLIDSMSTNTKLFEQRMREEGVNVEVRSRLENIS